MMKKAIILAALTATLPFAISSQLPKHNAMRAEFTNVELVPQVVKNFREGAL